MYAYYKVPRSERGQTLYIFYQITVTYLPVNMRCTPRAAVSQYKLCSPREEQTLVICGQVRFLLFSIHFSIIYLCFDSFTLLRESVDSPADFVLPEYFYTALIRSTITPVFEKKRLVSHVN